MPDPTIPSQDESAYLAAIEEGMREQLASELATCTDLAAALKSLTAPEHRMAYRLLLQLVVVNASHVVRSAQFLQDAMEDGA